MGCNYDLDNETISKNIKEKFVQESSRIDLGNIYSSLISKSGIE